MKAFLEQNLKGDWFDDFVYQSKYRLIDLGFEIVPFNGDDLSCLKKENIDISQDVVFGSVEATVDFFKKGGISIPQYLGYPSELKEYMDRNIFVSKFKDLYSKEFPFFIKPVEEVKLFTGDIIEKESYLDNLRDFNPGVKDDTSVYVSDIVDFVSEHRCFVFENDLKGVQFYLGDFKKFPSIERIEEMIKKYKQSPVAYTLDVGITDKGETLLVEVNDMWAIGSYGFDSKQYVLSCVRRQREIYNSFIINNQIV